MTRDDSHPRLYWLAFTTAAVALLPIVVGALVTTLRAGMAFLDWPSSDGHNMFLYPWLSAGSTDKFVEHGHRLAGALVGLLSIILAVAFWRTEPRRWVRRMAVAVLLGVIGQGLLGGLRVINNDPRLALVHGNFAAWVFSLMAALVLVSSRGWRGAEVRGQGSGVRDSEPKNLGYLKPWAVVTIVAVFAQSLLGGFLRHLGYALHEHLMFAAVVVIAVVPTVITAHRTRIGWLRRPAWLLAGLVAVQIGLGVGAWATKFGFPPLGYVAVQESTAQIFFRTAHFVVGLLTFMAATSYALRVFRLSGSARRREVSVSIPTGLTVPGGVR